MVILVLILLIIYKDFLYDIIWSLHVNGVDIPPQSNVIMLSILKVTDISYRNTNKPHH